MIYGYIWIERYMDISPWLPEDSACMSNSQAKQKDKPNTTLKISPHPLCIYWKFFQPSNPIKLFLHYKPIITEWVKKKKSKFWYASGFMLIQPDSFVCSNLSHLKTLPFWPAKNLKVYVRYLNPYTKTDILTRSSLTPSSSFFFSYLKESMN